MAGWIRRTLVLGALLGTACERPPGPSAAPSPLIPLDELFGNPVAALPKISPDGQWLGFLEARQGKLNVKIRATAGGTPRFLTADSTRSVDNYRWTVDSRAVVYLQDRGGDEGYHLIKADLATGTIRDLTPFPGVETELLALPVDRPHLAIVSMNRPDPKLADAYRIDLQSGAVLRLTRNPGDFIGYGANRSGEVLVAMALDTNGRYHLHTRPTEASAWRVVRSYPADVDVALVESADAPRFVYLKSNHGSEFQQLTKLDLGTGEETAVSADPAREVDLDEAWFDPRTGRPQAARYVADTIRWWTPDSTVRAVLTALPPARNSHLLSSSADGRYWTVAAEAPTAPTTYYLVDTKGDSATSLMASRPWLARFTLAPTEPIRVTARDSVVLPGYLTIPLGGQGPPYPTVLRVHGGPWARDYWGFDSDLQFLANRGYAVLSVNFRGSTGFGKRFAGLARKQFGRAMQTDLLDAVDWAVARGVTDPNRVAIFGGSYGGYATLMALTRTPDRFRCGIDLAGPANLVTLMEAFPPSWTPFLSRRWHPFVGNPSVASDRADLLERSPLTRIDSVRSPLLVFQGANDPRVTQAQSDSVVLALHRRKIPVVYLLASNEGHSFGNQETSLAVNRAAELFLARCLGGRAGPAPTAEIQRALDRMTVNLDSLAAPH